jgi:4-hydroxythreonine-4-phosphate dehydrogenase
MGDPAGIGPEVIDKAMASNQLPDGFEFQIVGDRSAGTPGKPDAGSAMAAMDALNQAAEEMKAGSAHAVVTGPVSKEALQSVGFQFPGQTEFFADAFDVDDYGMMLTGASLTVSLVTIHEALTDVPGLLSSRMIHRIGMLTAAFLKRRGISQPRIAVAGLNPHSGENGAFGNEESRIILPAIRSLNATGEAVFTGPAIPDSVFREAVLGHFDAVVAMYHDQGLIPLKIVDFDNAVNVTLGLPVPRTSPDHGTAFGIAGKDQANPTSMISAIRLACELAGHR